MFCDQWPSGFLRDLQVPQHASDVLVRADGDEAAGGLDEIARPHQVIAAQVVVALGEAPRDRQAGDDAAFHALRFVRPQHRRAELIQRRSRVRRDAAFEPLRATPATADVLGLRRVEVLEQADERVLTGFHRGRTEAERQHEHAVRRCRDRFRR